MSFGTKNYNKGLAKSFHLEISLCFVFKSLEICDGKHCTFQMHKTAG